MFKYAKLSSRYFFAKFPYLFILVLAPSILMSFLLSPSAVINFICNFAEHDTSSFRAVYLCLVGTDVKYIYLGVIGLVLLTLSLSIMFGAVHRHMLTGEFDLSFGRLKTRLNYNLLTALKVVISIGFLFEVSLACNACVLYICSLAFSNTVAIVVSLILIILLYVVFLLLFSIFILWAPNMLHMGYSTGKAFSMAIQMIRGNNTKVALALGLSTLPSIALMIVFSIFSFQIGNISLIKLVDSVTFIIISMYYLVLMYTVFFDVTGTERADLKQTFTWKKK